MNFKILKENKLTIAKISCRIGSTNSDELQNSMVEFISADASRLAIDFSGINYISSAGLRSTLTATKEIMKKRDKPTIFDIRANLSDVFDMSDSSSIMNITNDLAEAKSVILS